MTKKPKLELTWIGKDERPRLEPRILLPDYEHSHHAATRSPDGDCFDNKLIYGDNLLVLKSLEQDYTGKVKCIYIDPPYNTGHAFTHYEDGLEHSIWLDMMRHRLELLRALLAEDGSLWIHLDDNEVHYAKVLCDEIFGRKNFITSITWHKKRGKDNSSRYFSTTHDYILVYSKDASRFYINRLTLGEETIKAYKNQSNDSRGNYRLLGLWSRQQGGSEYEFTDKKGVHYSKRLWLVNKESMERLDAEDRLVSTGDKLYRKLFLYENKGSIPETIWTGVSNNANAKDELKKLFGEALFDTPKPEKLMGQIIEIATNEGDLVLDSFAGSGTTGAVAHKMKRKWIMVELGDHCYTHIVPRMKQVVDGTDAGGISKSVGWKGGGGFQTYMLAPSMLKKDKWKQWIINKEVYNPERLAEAMCKHMGFKYAPDDTYYWMQGRAHENSYIYVTTQTMEAEQLHVLNAEVGERRSLLVCCSAFMGADDIYKNLTIKKIPEAVLAACEWARDDYSLRVDNLPMARREAAPRTAQDDFFNAKDDNDG